MLGGISSARSRSDDVSCTRTSPMDKVASVARRGCIPSVSSLQPFRASRRLSLTTPGRSTPPATRTWAGRAPDSSGSCTPRARPLPAAASRASAAAWRMACAVLFRQASSILLRPGAPQCTPHVLHPPDPHDGADGPADSIGSRRAVGVPAAAGWEPGACSAVEDAISSSYLLPPGQYSHSPWGATGKPNVYARR